MRVQETGFVLISLMPLHEQRQSGHRRLRLHQKRLSPSMCCLTQHGQHS